MKIVVLLTVLLVACSSTQKAVYKEQEGPKFSSSRMFVEKPEIVMRAAKAVLEELTLESDPPAAKTLKENSESASTGWVYSLSKDKYLEYSYNGVPHRKKLGVRRKYSYHVLPSLSGTQVTISVEEEVQDLDLTTAEMKGWKSVEADSSTYDLMLRRLREKIRAQ